MGMFYTVLILCLICVGVTKSDDNGLFSVTDFKAVGDGKTDDTKAFQSAWAAACGSTASRPTMIIPACKTFLVMPTTFEGPCSSTYVNIQVNGTILAPDGPAEWQGDDASQWLQFKSVSGLTFSGSGRIDGRGYNWWKRSCKRTNNQPGCIVLPPTSIRFDKCNHTLVTGVNFVDSPRSHLTIYRSQGVNVTWLNITAPETSPNTDGIHVDDSQHVRINDCDIGTGDDCISIGDGVHDVVIQRINCGPGHGVSVGSLGKGGRNSFADEIHVSHVQMFNTTNGARIKTWQGATGSASRISFEHVQLTNVANPIIIDQYYCNGEHNCTTQQNAMHISNVTFAYFTGTSKTQTAVVLDCSRTVPCTAIHFRNINLTAVSSPNYTQASCINAHGDTSGYMFPPIPCLQK